MNKETKKTVEITRVLSLGKLQHEEEMEIFSEELGICLPNNSLSFLGFYSFVERLKPTNQPGSKYMSGIPASNSQAEFMEPQCSSSACTLWVELRNPFPSS